MNTPTLAVLRVIRAVMRPIPEVAEVILEAITDTGENPVPGVPAMWAVWPHLPTTKSFTER